MTKCYSTTGRPEYSLLFSSANKTSFCRISNLLFLMEMLKTYARVLARGLENAFVDQKNAPRLVSCVSETWT